MTPLNPNPNRNLTLTLPAPANVTGPTSDSEILNVKSEITSLLLVRVGPWVFLLGYIRSLERKLLPLLLCFRQQQIDSGSNVLSLMLQSPAFRDPSSDTPALGPRHRVPAERVKTHFLALSVFSNEVRLSDLQSHAEHNRFEGRSKLFGVAPRRRPVARSCQKHFPLQLLHDNFHICLRTRPFVAAPPKCLAQPIHLLLPLGSATKWAEVRQYSHSVNSVFSVSSVFNSPCS